MIVTALSAIAALGAAAWSQHKNNKATKEQQALNKLEHMSNQQDFVRSAYRNSLDSPTAKGQLENLRRNTENANMARDNANVAGNLTHQNALASKNATNATVANATNNIVAGQERAQAIKDEQYMNREKSLNAVDQAYKGQEARSRDALTANIIGSIGDVAATFDGVGNKRADAELGTIDNQNAVNEGLKNNIAKPKIDMSNVSATPVSVADLNNDKGVMSVVNRATGGRDFNALGSVTKDYNSADLSIRPVKLFDANNISDYTNVYNTRKKKKFNF